MSTIPFNLSVTNSCQSSWPHLDIVALSIASKTLVHSSLPHLDAPSAMGALTPFGDWTTVDPDHFPTRDSFPPNIPTPALPRSYEHGSTGHNPDAVTT